MDIIQKWELKNEIKAIEIGEYLGRRSILLAEIYRRRTCEKLAELIWPGTDWYVDDNTIALVVPTKIKNGSIIVKELDKDNIENNIYTYDKNKNFSRAQL